MKGEAYGHVNAVLHSDADTCIEMALTYSCVDPASILLYTDLSSRSCQRRQLEINI
jgi:hypothetical protein